MIISFFIDNRVGGPHINFFRFEKILKKKITYVTVGKSNFSNIYLLNLRFLLKIFYPLEICINIIQIIFLFKKKECIFISNGIYNLAPVIAGSILKKKTYWYLLEEPNYINKITFNIISYFFDFEILSISKNICKNYKIKRYKYFPPFIETKKIKLNKINKSTLKIISVGNINKIKNHFFSIRSLSRYKSNYKYEIVGSKLRTQIDLFNSIKRFIKLKKLQSKIKLLGYKNQKQIQKYLKKNDIFLLPSMTEGCPISLLEALASGKLCICTKVGDIPIIIKNGINGFLIKPNEKNLHKVLNQIKNLKQSSLKRIRINSIKTIKKKFSNKNYYKFLLSF